MRNSRLSARCLEGRWNDTLFQPLPSSSLDDETNVSNRMVESLGDIYGTNTGCIKLAHFFYLLFSKQGARMMFPARMAMLTNRVCHVILVSTNEKMVWSNTRWIVAMMTNVIAIRDRAEVKYPRGTTCVHPNTVPPKHAIPLDVFRSGPVPTTIRLFHLVPKPNILWNKATVEVALS